MNFKVTCKGGLKENGVMHAPGAILEMSEKAANSLPQGTVEAVIEAPKQVEAPKVELNSLSISSAVPKSKQTKGFK